MILKVASLGCFTGAVGHGALFGNRGTRSLEMLIDGGQSQGAWAHHDGQTGTDGRHGTGKTAITMLIYRATRSNETLNCMNPRVG